MHVVTFAWNITNLNFCLNLFSHVTQSTFLSLFNDFSSPDKFATFNLHSLVLTKDLVKLIYVDTFWALNPDPRRWHFFVFTQRCSMINCSKPVVAFVQKHDLNAQMRSWRSPLKTTILFARAQIELEAETETHIRSFCSILYRVFTFLSFTVSWLALLLHKIIIFLNGFFWLEFNLICIDD